MKLYELPNRSYFKLCEEARIPPDAPAVTPGEVYWFGHVDGMYSFCKDSTGQIVHLAAWTEVEPAPAPTNREEL